MDLSNKISDFISEDIAYFLGLVVGKGRFYRSRESNQLIIEFPFKILEVETGGGKLNTPLHLSRSLDAIVRRLKKLGIDVSKEENTDSEQFHIRITFPRDSLSWQFLSYLLNGEYTDYHSFRIPRAVFMADEGKQKEFLRGYFDVTGHARKSNNFFGEDKNRVYLEVDHRNWFLVVDLVELLKSLEVPIQNINFGHPNLRDPDAKSPNSKSWAKEHQLKIFANQFTQIGSYLEHKNRMLEEIAALNRPTLGAKQAKPSISKKPPHPQENSDKLPPFLRSQHFDHYLQILRYLQSQDRDRPYEQ